MALARRLGSKRRAHALLATRRIVPERICTPGIRQRRPATEQDHRSLPTCGGSDRSIPMTPQARGFRALMAAQFLSALADNALLIVAIALLDSRAAAAWMTPFLKFFFIASFVAFAFVVGVIADSFAKPRVMMTANAVKGL